MKLMGPWNATLLQNSTNITQLRKGEDHDLATPSLPLTPRPPITKSIQKSRSLYKVVKVLNSSTNRRNQVIQCRLCAYKATKLGNMKDHIRTHTNEEPFACRFCDKKFSLSGNRKRHEKMLTCLARQGKVSANGN